MWKKARRIYLDHAAVTPVDRRVQKIIKKVSRQFYANPSSIHREGVEASRVVAKARATIASLMRAHPDEIIFTGSGTEANNLAIFGAYDTMQNLHIVTSVIEHPSVLEPIRHLERKGVKVTYVGVDEKGIIDPKEVKKAITDETFLVSLMMVNNEVGTIQPLREIAKIVRHVRKDREDRKEHNKRDNYDSREIFFHTDASQAPAHIPIDTQLIGADMITLDSHKVYGPRGVGMLWVKRSVHIEPIIFGGKQERGLRSATENVPGIAGFAVALELCAPLREKESLRLGRLRDFFLTEIKTNFPDAVLNGSENFSESIPSIINISFLGADLGADNEFLLLQLDAHGIACSTRSSCLKDDPGSYVLKAMGLSESAQRSALRFSMGRGTKKRHIKRLIKTLKKLRISHLPPQ